MKKIIFISCLLLMFQTAKSQSLSWAFTNGASGPSTATDVSVDSSGNIYVVGTFDYATDFDPGPGILNLNPEATGKGNIFCGKYSSSGNMIWVRQIGDASNFSSINPEYYEPKVTVDSANNIYVSGLYYSDIDFDPGAGVYYIPPPNADTGNFQFIAKYSSAGNFIWAKGIDGGSKFTIQNIKTDSNNNIILSGVTYETIDADPSTTTVYNLTNTSTELQTYLLKLSTDGNFVWAFQTGDFAYDDYPFGLAIDNSDNIYQTGFYSGTSDFDPSANTFNLSSNNNSPDIFLSKFNSSGNLVWAKSFGTTDTFSQVDKGRAVTTDNAGNVYLAGNFSKTIDMDPSAAVFNLSTNAGASFVAKYNSMGEFIFAKSFTSVSTTGTNLTEDVYDIKVDANTGNLFFTGNYLVQMDCDPDAGVYNITANGGNEEVFLICYSSVNGQFNWAKSFGGVQRDRGRKLAVHPTTNRLTLVGELRGSNVDFDSPNGYFIGNGSNTPQAYTSHYTFSNLGIEDFQNQYEVNLYPNPVNEILNISTYLTIQKLEVIDMLGKKIINSTNVNSIKVDGLKNGIYFLKLTCDNVEIIKRFVKF